MITRAIGADTLTFCPPLVITDEQIDRVVDALAASVRGDIQAAGHRPDAVAELQRDLVVAGRIADVEPGADPLHEVGAGSPRRPVEERLLVDVRREQQRAKFVT